MGALFVNALDEYKIDIDPYAQAREQLLVYIEKTYETNGEEANILYKEMLEQRDVKDPTVLYVNRENGMDKKDATVSLLDFIEETKNKGEAMTPSFTCYDREEESFQGLFIQDGLANRSAKKKEAAKCEGRGDKLGFLINNLLQKAFKLRNNSLSGAYLSLSTIFYNPSSHTALTSGTRLAASLANMVTETMVAGRRYYRDPESVINHFLTILSSIDKEDIKKTNKKYNILNPTKHEVMMMVEYSISDYWSNDKYLSSIRNFVSKLDGEERSAIMFTYDMFHLEKVNPVFVRGMLDTLAKPHIDISSDIDKLKEYDEFIINIAHHICFGSLRGKGNDYKLFSENLKDLVVSTTIVLDRNLKYYKEYIDTYLKSNIMPINIPFIKDMIMEAVSHSDTDSTCGWYGDRVQDRFGKMEMNEKGIAYFSVYMMFNSGVVSHLLRQLTANFNVALDKRDKLAMKNEYFFPVFGSANTTKHYIANIMLKEGLVYQDAKLEIKGNSLISSNNDKFIRDHFTDLVKTVTDTLTKGEQLNSEDILGNIADLERAISTKLYNGDASVFKLEKVNNTYKVMKNNPDNWVATNLYHHHLYKEVFASTYGETDLLPYIGVSVPIQGNIKELVEEIEDISIRNKFSNFLKENPKKSMERIIIPYSVISKKGLPKELQHFVNEHELIHKLLTGHYILLEILGIYLKEGAILKELGY